jgi:hypothetical protein
VQKVDGALRVSGGLKDRALVVAELLKPIFDIGGVLFAGFGCELEACAQKGCASSATNSSVAYPSSPQRLRSKSRGPDGPDLSSST